MLIPDKKNVLWRTELCLTFVHAETCYAHAVNAKHECLESRSDALQVAGGVDNSRLHARSMYNFEEWVDIIKKDLPHLEDLDGFRVNELNCCLVRSKQEEVMMFECFFPCLFEVTFIETIAWRDVVRFETRRLIWTVSKAFRKRIIFLPLGS